MISALNILFSWLPGSLRSIALGLVAFFILITFAHLIKLILDLIPFV